MRFLQRSLTGLLLLAFTLLPAITRGEESVEQRNERMRWFRDAKFGMFIHWGVYAVPAGTYQGKQIGSIGEWIMHHGRIPVKDYKAFARQFNPVKYNPEAWAQLAADAGMKYIVITSKHHDGFALFDSAVTDWDVVNATPYGKDLLAPLAAAARERGLKFGLYYSQAQDWNHPGGAKAGFRQGDGWDADHKGNFDEYLKNIAVPQTREILSRFHPDILWWDTPTWMTNDRAKPLHDVAAQYPQLITNNRLGGDYRGDTETPEQSIPATGYKDRDWETCMTMNDTWGFKSYDTNWKSTKNLLRNLVDVVSKGGNYLLNVGPTAEGEIPQASIDRLREIGRWIKVNGDAIYGTTASPCSMPTWGRLTRKGNRLFLHVFEWPQDGQLPIPLLAKTVGCRLLADPARTFTVKQAEDSLIVQLTGQAPDAICSVVELTIEGEPQAVVSYVKQQADGSFDLTPERAQIHGGIHVEQMEGKANLGYWTNAKDSAEWLCRVARPGRFLVEAEIASPSASQLIVEAGKQRVVTAIEATGNYQSFVRRTLGKIEVSAAGDVSVAVRPDSKAWHPINLRHVTLTPVQ